MQERQATFAAELRASVAVSRRADESLEVRHEEPDREVFDPERSQTQREWPVDEDHGLHRSSPAAAGMTRSLESQWLLQMGEDRRAFLEALRESTRSLSGSREADAANNSVGLGREPNFRKLEEAADVEHYLVAFERFAATYQLRRQVWAQKLAPLLSSKAQAAYASMDITKIGDYDAVKKAILRRYDIHEETYRQRFRSCKKGAEESYAELGIKLQDLFGKWIQPEIKSKEEICDMMVLEQLLDGMPHDLRVWLKERKPKTLSEAVEMADNYVTARRDLREKRTCARCGKVGHLARFCRSPESSKGQGTASGPSIKERDAEVPESQSKLTGSTKGEPVGEEQAKLQGGKEHKRGCFQCGQTDHYKAQCPQLRRSGADANCHVVGQDQRFCCHGRVNDRDVCILLDTGAGHTLVREGVVAPEAIQELETLRVGCCHGDWREYHTAKVKVEVGNKVLWLRAGVVPHLPRDVLLGTDVEDLPSLAAAVNAAGVHTVTRAQARHENQKDIEVQAKCAASGARPRNLMNSSESTVASEDFSNDLRQFDDEIFESATSTRRTRRQRREARKEWCERQRNTPSDEAVTCEPCPEVVTDQGPELRDWSSGVIGTEELKRLQREDASLVRVREYAGRDEEQAEGARFLWRDGVLYRQWKPRKSQRPETVEQIVLPVPCRRMVMGLAHDRPTGGHLGRKKTQDHILQHFYWPNLFKEVAEYCKCCDRCQKTARLKRSERAPLVPLPIIEEPFQRIAMDIVGPLERTPAGYKYILVVCDYATRYPEAFPLKSIDAPHVAERLWELFSRMGIPTEILTDQRTNFMSSLLQELHRMLGVKSIRTSPYHPQTDGLVERFNGTLKNMLRKFATEEQGRWAVTFLALCLSGGAPVVHGFLPH